MTRLQVMAGIAVFAVATGSAVACVQATKPAPQATASGTVAAPTPSTHSCTDMNGKTFGWSWSNVPFASNCDARPDAK